MKHAVKLSVFHNIIQKASASRFTAVLIQVLMQWLRSQYWLDLYTNLFFFVSAWIPVRSMWMRLSTGRMSKSWVGEPIFGSMLTHQVSSLRTSKSQMQDSINAGWILSAPQPFIGISTLQSYVSETQIQGRVFPEHNSMLNKVMDVIRVKASGFRGQAAGRKLSTVSRGRGYFRKHCPGYAAFSGVRHWIWEKLERRRVK